MLGVVSAVFAALMVLDPGSDPFVGPRTGTMPFGLNPLLLHPGMVLHPPALFVGYVGLAVPFAFAVSTLLLGRGDKLWVQRSQKWAVFGWLFLSLGIGLGAWWAYVVLSFGGFWAWDAVENTSLVPWLTATALLHSLHALQVARPVQALGAGARRRDLLGSPSSPPGRRAPASSARCTRSARTRS